MSPLDSAARHDAPFASLAFRHPWRPYQERVLAALHEHMSDRRLHVVAAPGAGKTSLGLEIFRRLGKRALVLSPTRVIRDQWVQRLGDFCHSDPLALPWVSTSLAAPSILTSVTYQAVHAQSADEPDAEVADDADAQECRLDDNALQGLIATLRRKNVEVLILDEAHHLRAEWWRALSRVCAALPDLFLVSLTATPPYDCAGHEWIKYEQLCGPIDEEISVPELVKAGTLCAHQDYVWAVGVGASERARIAEYDARVASLCRDLFAHPRFNESVLAHPWLAASPDMQAVAAEPRIAIALLVYLKAKQLPLPVELCAALDFAADDIPQLGRHWWQALIEAVLFSATFRHAAPHLEYVEQLKKQLRACELLKNRELSLERSKRVERSLALSSAKVQACVAIHKLESKHRREQLRQVILTDYIRDEQLAAAQDAGAVNFGAWPVFQALAAASPIDRHLGLLTGRISLIHESLAQSLLSQMGSERCSVQPSAHLPGFMRVAGPLNQLTAGFTQLLLRGDIKTLVGTRALLGEGWDAPAINSLILGSCVGTFMLTNQMRGRAIRIDKHAPEKISSVWHLVAIDANSASGLSDYRDLRQRFETFVGLSEKTDAIENGFTRMHATGLEFARDSERSSIAVTSNNWQMVRRYRKRASLPQRWASALGAAQYARILPSVETEDVPKIRSFHFRHTLKHLLFQFGLVAGSLVPALPVSRQHDLFAVLIAFGVASAVAVLWQLPRTIKLLRIFAWHLPVDGALRQIGLALADALSQAGIFTTPRTSLRVESRPLGDGTFQLALSGGTFHESSLFADALAEVLAPIDNPRYLLQRQGKLYGMRRDDYHAVPLQLAVKKETAQLFFHAWRRYVGPAELIYTRDGEGRNILLKAKVKAFSSVFARQLKRQDRWQ